MQLDSPAAFVALALIAIAVTLAIVAGIAAARVLFRASERGEPRP